MTRRLGDVSIRAMHSTISLTNNALIADAVPAASVKVLEKQGLSESMIWLWRER